MDATAEEAADALMREMKTKREKMEKKRFTTSNKHSTNGGGCAPIVLTAQEILHQVARMTRRQFCTPPTSISLRSSTASLIMGVVI